MGFGLVEVFCFVTCDTGLFIDNVCLTHEMQKMLY